MSGFGGLGYFVQGRAINLRTTPLGTVALALNTGCLFDQGAQQLRLQLI